MIHDRDVAVPMRDGCVLRADVFRSDDSDAGAPVPALLSRTPYDKRRRVTAAAAIDPERAVEAGFALVCQDVRGRHASEGDFYPFVAEGADGYDSVEWVAAQPWCSGWVGMAGRSYAAATQWLAAAAAPPSLRGIAPVVTGSDSYDGWVYQGGAFQLGFNLFWVHMMSGGKANEKLDEFVRRLPLRDAEVLDRSDAGRFYRDWLDHPMLDDYWAQLAGGRRDAELAIPVFNVGGWYDVFLSGTIANYMRHGTRLLIGPWAHGSAFGPFPDHSFDAFENDQIDVDGMLLDFLGGRAEDVAPVRIFVMGVDRWRDEDGWPLARAHERAWFLRAGGELLPGAPADGEEADSYVYDPADPTPTIGGPTSLPGGFMRKLNAGPLDQRPVEDRGDVLVYSSPVLDEPLEVTGPLKLVLWVASEAEDADFVARLCDVAPDGESRLLVEGVLRARYRGGFETAEPLDGPTELEIDLAATSNVFRAGHRIRLLVTSSSFPRFDRNPGVVIPPGDVTEADLRAARQTIFHDAARPSRLLLPVV